MKLLLINPKYPESFWSFKWAVDKVLPGKRAINPPLGLATLAALCPPHWQVTIVDENIESVAARSEADLVGVCGMGVQFPRQKELLAYYRSAASSSSPAAATPRCAPSATPMLADTVVAGEAEYIWKVLRRLRNRRGATTLPRDRLGATGGFADTAFRPAQARPVHQRDAAVLARLPVPLRVLRHHRDVRAQAAHEEPGAGRARAGRAAGRPACATCSSSTTT